MGLAVARDISLIWLIFLTLVAILPLVVIFFYMIKGMIRLRALTKEYMPIVLFRTRQVAEVSEQISVKIAEPVINAHAKAAQVNGITRATFTRRKAA